MGKHWKERLEMKKNELLDDKADKLYTAGLLMVIIVAITIGCHICYTIGYSRGEDNCTAQYAELRQLQYKGYALASEASRIIAVNQEFVDNCKAILNIERRKNGHREHGKNKTRRSK